VLLQQFQDVAGLQPPNLLQAGHQPLRDGAPPLHHLKDGVPLLRDGALPLLQQLKDGAPPLLQQLKDGAPPLLQQLRDGAPLHQQLRDGAPPLLQQLRDGAPALQQLRDGAPPLHHLKDGAPQLQDGDTVNLDGLLLQVGLQLKDGAVLQVGLQPLKAGTVLQVGLQPLKAGAIQDGQQLRAGEVNLLVGAHQVSLTLLLRSLLPVPDGLQKTTLKMSKFWVAVGMVLLQNFSFPLEVTALSSKMEIFLN